MKCDGMSQMQKARMHTESYKGIWTNNKRWTKHDRQQSTEIYAIHANKRWIALHKLVNNTKPIFFCCWFCFTVQIVYANFEF